MADFSDKTRYKALGLLRHFEYASQRRSLGDRYVTTKIVTYLRPTAFESSLELVEHTIKQGETLHHLALHYYGDARLWWFIADYNDGKSDFTFGESVIIPPNIEVNAY